MDGEFKNASLNEIDEAAEKGTNVFNIYRKKDNNTITRYLEQIASEKENSGNKINKLTRGRAPEVLSNSSHRLFYQFAVARVTDF